MLHASPRRHARAARGDQGRVPRYRLGAPLGLLMAAALALSACGSSGSTAAASQPSASSPAPAKAAYPVSVQNCGTPVTFTSEPKRAVSNDINTTEDMLALGLQSRMAGDFGVTGDGPEGHPVPAQYLTAFHQVKDVSSDYFTLETLVGLHPDFLFAGWNYGLQAGTRLTPAGLAGFGIKTLALSESCARVNPGERSVSINDTYQDLANLGAIFNVRSRASKVIAQMKAQVAAAHAKVADLKPVSVFLYDSGQAAPFTAPGLAMPNALIQLGGGTNIFGSLKQSWTSVSWETVVARKPQCIIINDYGTPTWQQKEKFLRTDSVTKNLPAVRNNCILHLSYDELTPGPRNAQAVTAIARWLHPKAFS
jgi:iron complex transport system substrate-binding protein